MIKKDKQNVFSIYKNWLGVLKIYSFIGKKHFFLKTKNYWNGSKVLLDENGNELISLTKKYNWKKWNYDYSFDVLSDYDSLADHELLLFTLIQGDYLKQVKSIFLMVFIIWITTINN